MKKKKISSLGPGSFRESMRITGPRLAARARDSSISLLIVRMFMKFGRSRGSFPWPPRRATRASLEAEAGLPPPPSSGTRTQAYQGSSTHHECVRGLALFSVLRAINILLMKIEASGFYGSIVVRRGWFTALVRNAFLRKNWHLEDWLSRETLILILSNKKVHSQK